MIKGTGTEEVNILKIGEVIRNGEIMIHVIIKREIIHQIVILRKLAMTVMIRKFFFWF